jgi:hypothetical protein
MYKRQCLGFSPHTAPHTATRVNHCTQGMQRSLSTQQHRAARVNPQRHCTVCCAGNVEWGDKALQVAEAVLDRPENSNLSLYLFR